MKLNFPPLIIMIALAITGNQCLAQKNDVVVSAYTNTNQTVDFNYEKNAYGSFFLELNFDHIDNALPAWYKGTIKNQSGKLLTLKPLNNVTSIGYSFKYNYARGVLNPKIDTTFEYLLPVSSGKTVQVFDSNYLFKELLDGAEPKNWKAISFRLDEGDTIFAMRKGVVVDVIDGYNPDPTQLHSYNSRSNSVLVEQTDGTLAFYGVLKNGSIMVRPGDAVLPHTALALAGTFDVGQNTQCTVYVDYLSDDNFKDVDKMTLGNRRFFYSFINPLFYTKEGIVRLKSGEKYTSETTTELIQKEFTKLEKKKLAK